jgi:hypothetical protein
MILKVEFERGIAGKRRNNGQKEFELAFSPAFVTILFGDTT